MDKVLITIKMITLKEYKIYLKVKKFIETENCNENELISKLVNGIGIIPAYVPLIIESDDMEPTKYYSLSAAARDCGLLKQTIIYAYRNRCTRIVRQKGGTKEFRIEWDEINWFVLEFWDLKFVLEFWG